MRLTAALPFVASLAMLTGCGSGGTPAAETTDMTAPGVVEVRGRLTLDMLRVFADSPVYWAGETLDGLPVSHVGRYRSTSRVAGGPTIGTDIVTVVYGTCDQRPSCRTPLQVQSWRACPRPKGVGTTPLAGRTTVRGVPAGHRGGGLVIFTGPLGITVFAHPGEIERHAIDALAPANGMGKTGGGGGRLPPPAISNLQDAGVPCFEGGPQPLE